MIIFIMYKFNDGDKVEYIFASTSEQIGYDICKHGIGEETCKYEGSKIKLKKGRLFVFQC